MATIVAHHIIYHSSSVGRSRSARPFIESVDRTELGNSRVGKNLATCVTPSSTAGLEFWVRWFLDAISTSYIDSLKTVLQGIALCLKTVKGKRKINPYEIRTLVKDE